MAHPIHLVRRYQQKVDTGHYKTIGKTAAAKYRDVLTNVDPYKRMGQIYATKARLADKLALISAIISTAIDVNDLTDDDALAILIGWAAAERKR